MIWLGRLVIAVAAAAMLGFAWLYQADIPRAELEARYAGGEGRFVTLISGARAHYRDQGRKDAPVLVLLHGSNASLHTWEAWAAALKGRFRVISVDLPGHGLTGPTPGGDYTQKGMAGFVLEFVSALGLERFALAGSSMGGGVAARFALENPARVTRLALLDPGGFPSRAPPEPGLGFTLARLPVIQDALPYLGARAVYASSLQAAFADARFVTPAMTDRYWLLNRLEGSRRATLARFQTPPDATLQARAGEISRPTLIIWGEKDAIIPVDAAERWREAMPGAEIVIYPGVGHLPMEEAAARSAEDVAAFLTRE